MAAATVIILGSAAAAVAQQPTVVAPQQPTPSSASQPTVTVVVRPTVSIPLQPVPVVAQPTVSIAPQLTVPLQPSRIVTSLTPTVAGAPELTVLAMQQPPVAIAPQVKPRATAPQPQPRPEESRAQPQGFSVVLVLADLQASGGQDDVPAAARQALADMKDFLPYKSYKLLDAAWLLGQGAMGVRLRGPDEQEYDLRLVASPYASPTGRVSVQFSLRDSFSFAREAAAYEAGAEAAQVAAAQRADEAIAASRVAQEARTSEIRERQRELSQLQSELRQLRQLREKADQTKIRELEAKMRELERDITVRRQAYEGRFSGQRKATPSAGRAIIDTSFTMDIGETVVVGTSRLQGNSRALIALLTAVPPKASRARNESR